MKFKFTAKHFENIIPQRHSIGDITAQAAFIANQVLAEWLDDSPTVYAKSPHGMAYDTENGWNVNAGKRPGITHKAKLVKRERV